MMNPFSRALAQHLSRPRRSELRLSTGKPEALVASLRKGDVLEGVQTVSVRKYWNLHARICRPVGLQTGEIDAVVEYARSRIVYRYDLKNILDLARYLIPTPPVPTRWRRRLLALGSGDPTRAICSSLIAQAFQSIHYPILPESVVENAPDADRRQFHEELLHIRHHSLFAPRDFDISPYFEIVKPTLVEGFDPHSLRWKENGKDSTSSTGARC